LHETLNFEQAPRRLRKATTNLPIGPCDRAASGLQVPAFGGGAAA